MLCLHQLISFSSASSGFTVCHSPFTHLTHSCTSLSLLQFPACCGLIPSPGRYLTPAEVLCVLNSPLTPAVTSVVMSCLCEQHPLSGFLILNKPKFRYKLRHPFRHQKLFQQKFSFCFICRQLLRRDFFSAVKHSLFPQRAQMKGSEENLFLIIWQSFVTHGRLSLKMGIISSAQKKRKHE